MLYENEHGGGCCGITHLQNFGPYTPDQGARLVRLINGELEQFRDQNDLAEDAPFNHLFEVVLIDMQLDKFGWAEPLKTMGWRLVNRFYNSNSGNYCNVLHYTPHEPRGRNRPRAPYKW